MVNAKTGEEVAVQQLDSPVVWDGMAAANKRLYVSVENGEVVCFGK